MDLKDKRILYELDLNSRTNNKQIAKKLNISEQVLGYRIKRLIEEGAIRNFYIKINPFLIGYTHFKIYLKLKNIQEETEKELIIYLKELNNIIWLASTRGNYDLIISILAKNIQELTKIYNEILEKYGDYILQRDVIILEQANTFSRGYLLDKEPIEFKYSGGIDQVTLDREDKQILKILSNNARKNSVEISKQLNVSPDKVIYRIKKLIENNLITGFGTNIDVKKLGIKYYLISFKLQNMNKEKYSKFKSLAKKYKCVTYLIKTFGSHDLEIEIEANDWQLDNLIKDIKNNFLSELKEYEILEIKEQYKLDYYPFE